MKKSGDSAQFAQGLSVYIIGGNGQYSRMFESVGFRVVNNITEAFLVCFTGGEDVSPSLYGEAKHFRTNNNLRRDEYEQGIFEACVKLNKPMVGICRGGQFLNVMNGGKMWQDVSGHTKYHFLKDVITGIGHYVSSTHHQMMRPNLDTGLVMAIATEAEEKVSMNEHWIVGAPKTELYDTEVVWYKGTKSLCFQPHPEFDGVQECRDYFWQCVCGCFNLESMERSQSAV